MGGRTAFVSGGGAGIGLEIARGLVRSGYRTILGVRDQKRGQDAAWDIAQSVGSRAPEVLVADYSSTGSIREMARTLARQVDQLDVLVNNAGTWSTKRQETPDGIELVWATNQLGYFTTTELLLPLLKNAPKARVVTVASELARDLDLADVNFKTRPYSGVASYAQSKQANRMWTRALARRLAGTKVTANSLHPGGVATGLFEKGGGLLARVAGKVASFIGRTPTQGADTAWWLATADEVEGVTGRFFQDRKEKRCRFVDEAQEEKLYALCATMTASR